MAQGGELGGDDFVLDEVELDVMDQQIADALEVEEEWAVMTAAAAFLHARERGDQIWMDRPNPAASFPILRWEDLIGFVRPRYRVEQWAVPGVVGIRNIDQISTPPRRGRNR